MDDEAQRYQGAGQGRTCQHSVPQMLSTVGRSPTVRLLQYNNIEKLCIKHVSVMFLARVALASASRSSATMRSAMPERRP